MATNPVYYVTPVVISATIGPTANTNLDGTGTTYEVATGATGGRKVDRIKVKANATSTAGNIRLFYSPDGGTTKRLIAELAVTAITVAAGTNAWEGTFYLEGLYLADANAKLYAATHNAVSFYSLAELFAP